jgi:hypothetical protein
VNPNNVPVVNQFVQSAARVAVPGGGALVVVLAVALQCMLM